MLGLPGCARSPKLNGFDWVLQRLAAGIPVHRADIMAMGVGGLLMEIPTRPQPRDAAASRREPGQVAALVLAAGQSRRMGQANKLLALVDGRPMVSHMVDAMLASRAAPVIVVTGHEADRVRAALGDRPVQWCHNPDYADGPQHLAAGRPRRAARGSRACWWRSATCRGSRRRRSTA